MGEKKQEAQNQRIYSMKYISKLDRNDASFGPYLRQLEEAMRNKTLHNIALEGKRGSGKSSIIHSYDNERYGTGGEKLLYISLAEFEGTKPTDKEQLKKRLEYSMLSQILARCTKRDLRGSSLRAIPEVRESRRWVWFKYAYVFSLILLICALMYDAKFHLKCFGTMVEKVWTPNGCHLCACALAAVMTVGLGAYLFSRKPGFFRFGKLNVKTAKVEAEVAPSADIYCLDQYRFDLVHILNQIAPRIGYTVVIEDLELVGDKGCAMEIMSKLRELNLMVNAHRQEQFRARSIRRGWILKLLENQREKRVDKEKKQKEGNPPREKKRPETTWLVRYWLKWVGLKEPVRFIYAVESKEFDADSRTKFFDTIIPVTPALNRKNAVEILKNIFTDINLAVSHPETDKLIKRLATSVTDYRILYDIKTEHLFFRAWREKNQSDPTVTDPNEVRKIEQMLLAIATYKALFPYAYHLAFTQAGQGMLRNPKKDPIDGHTYDNVALELADFLFNAGYLDEESLTLVGYSQEKLKQQWADILISGTYDEKLDLLKRFDAINADREAESAVFIRVVKKLDQEGRLSEDMETELIEMLGKNLYDTAEAALKGFYSWLFYDKLTAEGLVNLMLYLKRYSNQDIISAIAEVNKGENHDEQLEKFQKKLRARLEKSGFTSRLREKKFREKVNDCVAVIALILGENEQSVRDQYLNVKSKATVS